MSNLSNIENGNSLRKKEIGSSSLLLEDLDLNSLSGTNTVNKIERKRENEIGIENDNEESDKLDSSPESRCQSLISENDSFTKENKKNMRIILKSKLGEKSILDIAKDLNNMITVK